MNKLKRSKSNRVLAGVCGGIGEYFNMDPVIVRVIWLVLTFALSSRIVSLYHLYLNYT